MASNKVPLKGYMDGIDISAWQDTIDITKVPCDFVIVKATEGTDYKNRYFAKHCDQVIKVGKLLGAFHYANGGDPHSEAEYFIAYSKKYVGKAILVLDWEGQNNPQFGRSDRAWCKEWCDHVYSKTGVKPLIYIQKSAMDNVKGLGYRLWVAHSILITSGRDIRSIHGMKVNTNVISDSTHPLEDFRVTMAISILTSHI